MQLNEIKPIHEGGKALAKLDVQRIKKYDIPATIRYVSEIIGVPVNEMKPLGSVGKMPDSGDIDIAMDINKYNAEGIHQKMMNALGEGRGRYQAGLKIGSYAVPIAGNPEKGFVQFDLMYVPNQKWAEFSYFSAGDQSKFKGAIRNILLATVAKMLDEPGVDAFVYDENGDLMVRAGRGLNPNLGLKRMYQMRGKHKRTGERLKTMKNVSPEDIKRDFPDLEFDGSTLLIDNPREVVQVLFGKGTKPSDVDTVEEIIKMIKSKFSKDKAQKIFDSAKRRASKLAGKMDIPEELQ
jgi:hypothetical protein